MDRTRIYQKAQRDVRKYDPSEGLGGTVSQELTIEITCGAAAKTARLFGSHDPSVETENAANGITITPAGSIDHKYLRSFLSSKSIIVTGLEISASSASQVKASWKFVRKDIVGQEQSQPILFRTSSTQMQDNKIEKDVNWLIDGESEIQIPMEADATLTITLLITGYAN